MAKYLVQRGHQVALMVIADHRKTGIVESVWDGVRVIETPDLLWGQLRSGWDLWDLANRIIYLWQDKKSYDLIHCFEPRPATIYPALFLSHLRKIPLLTDWNDWWGRGGLIDEVRPAWYRILFGNIETYYEEAFRKQGAGVTAITSALVKRAKGLGVPCDRILLLSGGAFPDFFKPKTKQICCEHTGLPGLSPILGFSSLDSHLDLDIVMQALSIVAERYPAVKLIITGKPANSILDMAKTYGVEDNLYLTGFLPYEELPWVLGCADIFLLPFAEKISNIGRWPNKICEYMSLGRPTISNPVGDIQTLFENHEIGLLARWDPADFAEKIIYLIENPDIATRLGENARNLTNTIFDWKILVCQLEEFYYSLLKKQN
jgi:glycosyltransferase involved in cell wall biosynthesis